MVRGQLPFEASEKHDLIEEVIYPLIYGRAMRLAGGNYTKAGAMIQQSNLDSSKDSYKRRIEKYEADIKSWIDERRTEQRRKTRP